MPKQKHRRAEKSFINHKKPLALLSELEVILNSPAARPPQAFAVESTAPEEKRIMELQLTLDPKNRKGVSAYVYKGVQRGSVRISKSAFEDQENPPATVMLVGDGFQTLETKEQRKARLANAPKPTLAEKVAAQEKKLQALRAKLAKADAQPATQPA